MNDGDIKKVISDWLKSWLKRDWNDFIKYIQPSYLQHINKNVVIGRFAGMKLVHFGDVEIMESNNRLNKNVVKDVKVLLTIRNISQRNHISGNFRVRCIRESGDGKPVEEGGRWYINPASLREI